MKAEEFLTLGEDSATIDLKFLKKQLQYYDPCFLSSVNKAHKSVNKNWI